MTLDFGIKIAKSYGIIIMGMMGGEGELKKVLDEGFS